MNPVVLKLDLPGYRKVASGKVREIFDLGASYLFVATDRISAFDCIMPQGIPGKGRILTQLSRFWFEYLADQPPNHLISTELSDLPADLAPFHEQLDGRFMIVQKLEMIPVECVVRGYLVGSGFKEYQAQGSVCGLKLPAGLKLADRLPEPIFTPAAKAQSGHDENIAFETMVERIGQARAEALRALSLDIYQRAAKYALTRGVIIADTKFEFGLWGSTLVLADEVLTPDSSRYWPVDAYRAGANPPSFDKQYLRDYLEGLSWDKTPPAPNLPDDIVAGTAKRYQECFSLLTS
ncbi:MAG: phosphoribosylaminoimidazolesuccinocarboxamide synthase [Acidobacteria bacterium]|nr:phosphoribosylaminoimidazolesuccinocarboxamide synthase [Acidobacteriota bacterium]